MIHAIDHIDLTVPDIDEALEHYQALLGRKPVWSADAAGVRHVWFQFPNMALNIMSPVGPGVMGDSVRTRIAQIGHGLHGIAFAVRDIEVAQRLLERRGVPASAASPIRATDPAKGEKRYWNTSITSTAATAGLQLALTAQPEDAPPFPLSPPIGDERAAVAELDHIVIQTPNPERAAALYGARFGLDLRLDRPNPQLGNRLLFFKVGTAVVEIGARLTAGAGEGPDRFGGLAWRVRKPDVINARLAGAGFNVSEVRQGRKPGTAVFTVRDKTCGVPTIMIEQGAPEED
jgi:catechol 2,3-dioxygenase-like lactoylglutathione lyase family enzyme